MPHVNSRQFNQDNFKFDIFPDFAGVRLGDWGQTSMEDREWSQMGWKQMPDWGLGVV